MSATPDDIPIGLVPGGPISEHEHVELDFLRYENAHLQSRLRELERLIGDIELDRDTIQHERNLAIQDLRWTLDRMVKSPFGPALRRMDGFQRLRSKWGS